MNLKKEDLRLGMIVFEICGNEILPHPMQIVHLCTNPQVVGSSYSGKGEVFRVLEPDNLFTWLSCAAYNMYEAKDENYNDGAYLFDSREKAEQFIDSKRIKIRVPQRKFTKIRNSHAGGGYRLINEFWNTEYD